MSIPIRNQSNPQKAKETAIFSKQVQVRASLPSPEEKTSHKGYNLRPKASDTQDIAHLSWESSSEDLAKVLRSLQEKTPAYIHPRPISFEIVPKKKSLERYLRDAAERQLLENSTFREFWNRSHNSSAKSNARSLNKTALLLTHCQSRIGKPDWKEDWWHCWGVALLKKPKGYGKILIIYDCDTDDSLDFDALRPKEFLLSAQCQFIDIASKKGRLDSIWIGNAGLKSQRKWNCIFNTAQWIQQLTPGLAIAFQAPDDERLRGFHQIKRR